ncbi:MAG TPA: polyprenol monophosphomannose synthase, partial [Tepidisphaeraceae bacterium]|nr:polyprenol monophosphomannose synthase [Tepidisphaeraceae bacterium]
MTPPTDPPAAVDVSVVVPTRDEAENLPLLLPRIDAALRGRATYEVLVVDDDSRDGTPAVCAALAKTYPLRLLVRTNPADGLSGAVLHGFAAAGGRTLVVMDADLQHPPERLPALLDALDAGADFVIGSRHAPGASTQEQWGALRRLNSRVATLLARPFAGRTRDPMSGFFALRRSTLARAGRLTPLGYKIALELMCKCRVRDAREVPIDFGTRARGYSKLTLKEQFRYLEHLSRLYDYAFPAASPRVKFLIVTAASWAVGFGLYALLATAIGQPGFAARVWPVVLAYAGAIAVTGVFHARYVRTQRAFLVNPRPWADFLLISAAELAAATAAAAWLAWRVSGPTHAELLILPFSTAMGVRYVLRKEYRFDVRGYHPDPRSASVPSPG